MARRGMRCSREEKKPMPISRIARPKCSIGKSIRTPSASITSADPLPECDARFPCFATRAPAAAATIAAAVEILNVPNPLPPVPHVSTRCSGGSSPFANTGAACRRITLANPASSSTRTGRAFIAVSSRTMSAVSTLPDEQLFHHRLPPLPARRCVRNRLDQLRILSSGFGRKIIIISPQPCSVLYFPSTLLCLRRQENSNTTEPR